MDYYIGTIIAVAFDYAPIDWVICNGQLLPIDQYSALYSLIGTTYGGDGTTNFAVPNLCGRTVLNQGTGTGLSARVLGQIGGAETVALQASQVGSHSHPLLASAQNGTSITPGPTTALGQNTQPLVSPYAVATPNTTLAPTSLSKVGSGQAHENRQPYLGLTYIINCYGLFPTQE